MFLGALIADNPNWPRDRRSLCQEFHKNRFGMKMRRHLSFYGKRVEVVLFHVVVIVPFALVEFMSILSTPSALWRRGGGSGMEGGRVSPFLGVGRQGLRAGIRR